METKTIIPGPQNGPLMILELISDTTLSVTIDNNAIDYFDDLKSRCIDDFGPVIECAINCLSKQDAASCILKLEKLCSVGFPVNHMIAMDLYDVESVLSKNKAGIYRMIDSRPEDLKENTKRIVQSIKTVKPDLTGMVIYFEWDNPHMLKTILESSDVIPSIINGPDMASIIQAEYVQGKTESVTINVWGF